MQADRGPFGVGSFASHTALYINNGGHPILYDPAGSYARASKCRIGDACVGPSASLNSFIKFHETDGNTATIFIFNTTRDDEARIAKNIFTAGDADPLYCALSVVRVLKGVGPFKNLKSTRLPRSLASQLQKLTNAASEPSRNSPTLDF